MKLKTLKTGILFATLILFGSIQMSAQSDRRQGRKPPSFDQLLKKMDENEDGKLSEKEIKGPLKDHFNSVDTDEDGFISREEFDKAEKPKRRKPSN